MAYREAFPDFDQDDMPEIPVNWRDESWHFDACPFFLASPSVGVWIDYKDADARQFPENPRFMVERLELGQHLPEAPILLNSNDWEEVLTYIEALKVTQ